MNRWGTLLSAALICAATATPRSALGDKVPWEQPFAGDPATVAREAAKVKGADGDPLVMLLMDVHIRLDAEGRATTTRRWVGRVLTDAGIDVLGTVSRNWYEWYEDRPEIRARVIAADGAVRTLDPATIEIRAEDDDSPGVYSDGKVVRAPLPGMAAGAVAEVEVSRREHRPFFAAGVQLREPLAYSWPLRRSRIVVDAPATLPLAWKVPHARVEPRRSAAGGRTILTFEQGPVPGDSDPEPDRPDERPVLLLGTGRSWNDVASRYAEIVDDAIARGDVAALAREVRGDAAGRDAIVARLLERVHRDVRYVSIAFGDGSIVPRSPQETVARGFGDCKDKSTLLVALLRASGIPAQVALLRAGHHADVEPALPGLAFNHAIVFVPGNPALWIDPTDRFARAGELPLGDRGRRALLAARDTRALVDTPLARAADDAVIQERTLLLGEDGAARIVEITRRTGEPERRYRAYRDAADLAADRRHLAEYMSRTYVEAKLQAVSARRASAGLRVPRAAGRRDPSHRTVDAALRRHPRGRRRGGDARAPGRRARHPRARRGRHDPQADRGAGGPRRRRGEVRERGEGAPRRGADEGRGRRGAPPGRAAPRRGHPRHPRVRHAARGRARRGLARRGAPRDGARPGLGAGLHPARSRAGARRRRPVVRARVRSAGRRGRLPQGVADRRRR